MSFISVVNLGLWSGFLLLGNLLPFPSEALAIVATPTELNGMISHDCSGFVLDIGLPETAHPLLLTNGHCATEPMMGGNEVLGNFPLDKNVRIFGSNSQSFIMSQIRVIYATMVDTDIAILELTRTTIRELREKRIQMYSLAQTTTVGETLEVISGEWQEKLVCKLAYMVEELFEGETISRNVFALGNSCVAKGGFSGSPVFNNKKEVIGLLTTGYDGSGPDCSENNPCEIRAGGERFVNPELSYATQVLAIRNCFTKEGNFNLELVNCHLPKPFTR